MPCHIYSAQAVEVHDGDTFTARVDLGFHVFIAIKVRLRDVDAPELGRPGGAEAGEYLRKLLMPTPYAEKNPSLIIESYKDRRSFERWVCDVELWDGSDLAETMVVNGHAVRVRP
jgi:endonuclease YncB( thermonuclease family)